MSLDELQSVNDKQESPRLRLILALREVDDNVVEASAHLEMALLSANPDSDEALLGGVLQCSFAELFGDSLNVPECAQRGERLGLISDPYPAALGQIHYGIWLATHGHYKASHLANRAAEELALEAGDTRLAASTQNNQGVDYLVRGLPVLALRKFQAALELLRGSDDADNQSLLTMLTSNIASTHLELGDFESANSILQSLVNSEHYDRNNPANLIDEVILAKASLPLDRPQEGYDRLSAVLAAIGSYGVIGAKAYAYSVVGELEIALGDVKGGIESFAQAKEYAQRGGDSLRINTVDIAFADALVGLGRYAQAQAIIDASIAELAERGPSMIQAQALDLRGDVLRAMGQRSSANAAKSKARQMQLNIAGAEHDIDLIMLGESLELANQANELAHARQEARQREDRAQRDIALRNTLVLVAGLLAFITYLGLSRRYERKVAKTIQTVNAELELKVSERTAALELEMAERLKTESERQALAQSLAESEKLQALGQLTSGVAHDFNNLMTVVTLSAGQLRDVAQIANSESVHDVDNILSAAESASDITASLLAYARKQPLTPQPTNLESFLNESLPLFESTLGNGMSLETTTHSCSILVDRGQLTTAIINLLLNAKEAFQGQGCVRLQMAELLETNEQGESKPWATISVQDNGQGMTAAELRRATEPFYTTKDEGHGTGLGLSMVDGFAKQSGGFLLIDSNKGEGTTVTLHIPLCLATTTGDVLKISDEQHLPLDGLVIVVDDQKAIRDVLCRLLEQMGLETRSASSGAEALLILDQVPFPDLLITDLMMPGEINGQQLANEVRKRYIDLPMLMMSGYTNSVELDVEFLHKPFTFEALRHAITRAMTYEHAV